MSSKELERRQTAARLRPVLRYNCFSSSDLHLLIRATALHWPIKQSVCARACFMIKIRYPGHKMTDQSICALDTQTNMYTHRDLSLRDEHIVESNLGLLMLSL